MSNKLKFVLGLLFFSSLVLSCLFLPLITAQERFPKEALFYEKLGNNAVQCQLCPRRCFVGDGARGFCGIRENRKGVFYTLSYAKLVSSNDIDPIEKKPLFHFLPSTRTFSIATAGCNLRCKFCQNWEISQKLPEEVAYDYITPGELIRKVKASGRPTIAYTYSEPTIFYEYMLETAKLARKEGIRNVIHSNGYMNEEPLKELAKYLDAANIDLKGFTDDFYTKMSQGTLAPVLSSLKLLRKAGVHLEITNLVLSGYNDDEDSAIKMCLWIKENLGPDTPLHFSRAFPMYKLTSINPTPVDTLERLRRVAMDCGLKYVYIGNTVGHPAENTYCPKCKKLLIKRAGYFIEENNIEKGRCKFCGEEIKGVWE